jgi:hypothetical protein
VHADARLGLALFRERECSLDGRQTRAELQHEAVARSVEHTAATRAGDLLDEATKRSHLGQGGIARTSSATIVVSRRD